MCEVAKSPASPILPFKAQVQRWEETKKKAGQSTRRREYFKCRDKKKNLEIMTVGLNSICYEGYLESLPL